MKRNSFFTIERVLLLVIIILQSMIFLYLAGLIKQGKNSPIDSERYVKSFQQLSFHKDNKINKILLDDVKKHNEFFKGMDTEMNNFLNSFFNSFASLDNRRTMLDIHQMDALISRHMDSGWDSLLISPTMDMREDGNSYLVVFSLPEVNKSDISVILNGRLLKVKAFSKRLVFFPDLSEKKKRHVYKVDVRLPGPVGDADSAEANYTNGLLKVVVPKNKDNVSLSRRLRLL